jgi:hypothetical protein
MALTKVRLVTVIAETVLRDEVTATILSLGASGYTVIESEGYGSGGRRAGEIPGRNVRIETIVDEAVGERLVTHLSEQYFNSYSVICFLTDAWVVRKEKYVGKG